MKKPKYKDLKEGDYTGFRDKLHTKIHIGDIVAQPCASSGSGWISIRKVVGVTLKNKLKLDPDNTTIMQPDKLLIVPSEMYSKRDFNNTLDHDIERTKNTIENTEIMLREDDFTNRWKWDTREYHEENLKRNIDKLEQLMQID